MAAASQPAASQPAASQPAASRPAGHGDAIAEWTAARSSIKDFDDRIHDLRKLGFTFMTALLTFQALVEPYIASTPGTNSTPSSNGQGIMDTVKIGILLVTLLLIIILRSLESNYELYRKAAATRAGILERTYNLELTDTISFRYKHGSQKITIFYCLFAASVGTLGYFILTDILLFGVLLGFTIATILGLWYFMFRDLTYDETKGHEDWTIDMQECTIGTPIRIILTNLNSSHPLTIPGNNQLWKVESEEWDNGKPRYSYEEISNHDIKIAPNGTQIWIWHTNAAIPGVYQLTPSRVKLGYKFRKKLRSQFIGNEDWYLIPPPNNKEKMTIESALPREYWDQPLRRKITVWQGDGIPWELR